MKPVKEFTQLCLNRKLTLRSVDCKNEIRKWTNTNNILGANGDSEYRHCFRGEMNLVVDGNDTSALSILFVVTNQNGQQGILSVYGLGDKNCKFADKFIYASLDISFVDSEGTLKFNRDIYINLDATCENGCSFSHSKGAECWTESFIDFEDIQSVISISPEGTLLDLDTGVWVNSFKAEIFIVVTVCLSSRTTHDFLAEPSALPKMSSPAILSKLLKRILERKLNCDVVIKVDKAEFPAHMAILSANSPVFAAMFQTDMVEMNTGVVKIEDMSAKAVDAMLHFLYYRNMEKIETNVDIALEILRAADKYDIPDMKFTVTAFLCEESPKQFPMLTILEMYLYGHELDIEDIKSKALVVLKDKVRANTNTYDSKQCEIFNNFVKENSSIVSHLLLDLASLP